MLGWTSLSPINELSAENVRGRLTSGGGCAQRETGVLRVLSPTSGPAMSGWVALAARTWAQAQARKRGEALRSGRRGRGRRDADPSVPARRSPSSHGLSLLPSPEQVSPTFHFSPSQARRRKECSEGYAQGRGSMEPTLQSHGEQGYQAEGGEGSGLHAGSEKCLVGLSSAQHGSLSTYLTSPRGQ